MIYSDTDILEAIIAKTIKISPYSDKQLGTNSYDLRLGNTFYEVFWDDDGPFYVGPYEFNDGDKVYIPVSGTLLGVTKESVSTDGKVVAELRSRSTTRREGVTTNCDAGLGDVGYGLKKKDDTSHKYTSHKKLGDENCQGQWTMEFTAFVSNSLILEILIQLANIVSKILGKEIGKLYQFMEKKRDCRPYLIVGETVAQMVFFECKSEPTKKYDGQYQVEWPLNMIPKKWRHRVIAPK